MKVTYNWLKDYVDIKITAKELADKLTMAGLEVTSFEKAEGDWVFEFEVTSNRPDLLSVIGIAREVAAITGKKLKVHPRSWMLDAAKIKAQGSRFKAQKIEIKIQDKRDCPLYSATEILDVKICPSPLWLKRRLELVGIRSVNNIVDITNYVMLETGQPLHAFDLNKLADNTIFVRRGKEGEKILTIDGEVRNLTKEALVIADKEKPIALAGIMGGKDSEITQNSKDILLEAAIFNPLTVRRGRQRLGLSSESSYRFERGVDWQGLVSAVAQVINLILEIAGGRFVSRQVVKGSRLSTQRKKTIMLKTESIGRILGQEYSISAIQRVLSALGFGVKKGNGVLKVVCPSFRMDVSDSIDLIEEVARICGYENIPKTLPKIIPQEDVCLAFEREKCIKDILISQGLDEAITLSLMSKEKLSLWGYQEPQLITIANPLTREQEVLRLSLIPSLVTCISYNLNQKQENIRIFEIAKIFSPSQKNNQEQLSLSICLLAEDLNVLHLKGILELLLERLNIKNFEFSQALDNLAPYFQKEASLSVMVNKEVLGAVGIIRSDILERLDIQKDILAAELNLDALFAAITEEPRRYIPLPLYPQVRRDMSIILKEDIPAGEILLKIKESNIPYLAQINLKDYYLGEQIPEGFKGITLSCVYQAIDHTLTSEEVEQAYQKVLDILKIEFGAQQR